MKTEIAITLYILGAIIYLYWCLSDNESISYKFHKLEATLESSPVVSALIWRLLTMTFIMAVGMLWPAWLLSGLMYANKSE